MPIRSMTLRFGADISGYMAGVRKMEQQTRDFGTRVGATATKQKKDWDSLGTKALAVGGALAVGVGYATKTFMDFDKAMSGVGAVADATSGQMDKLRAAAIKAGADTAFSASDAAKAESELAKAGVSVTDILHGGLIGSMNLAAAGQIDLGDAATISAQAMNIFSLKGKDVGHIADVMAAAANKSATDVGTLGQALQQGGLLAAQTGLSLEATVGTLAAFSDSALNGSDAGTSLKTMLQRLTPQSAQAAAEMQRLGFSAYDAKGNFVGMPELAGRMQKSFGDMTPKARNAALAVIFGSDAVRGANVLLKQGETGIRNYISAVDDQGAASRMAGKQMDNLAGDVEQLKGSLETLFIKGGSSGNEFFRGITQNATGVVNFFSNLPGPVQKTVYWLTAATSGALLFMGAAMKAVGAARDMKETMDGLAQSSLLADGRLTGAAKAVGAVGLALGGLAIAGNAAQQMYGRNVAGAREAARSLEIYEKKGRLAAGVTGTMSDAFSNLGDYVRYAFQDGVWGHAKEASSELFTAFGLFGPTGVDTAQNFFKEIDSGLTQMLQSGKRAQAEKIFAQIARAAKEQGISMAQLKDKLPAYSAAMDGVAASSKRVAEATKQTRQATVDVQPPMDAFGNKLVDDKGKALDARDAMNQLADSIRGLGNTAIDASNAEISFQQAIDDATKSVKENGRNTDINTQKGRANRQALNQLATSSHELTGALVENNASQKKVTQSMKDGRTAFIRAAESMGYSRQEAKKLADQAGFTRKDIDKVTESLKIVAKQHPKPTVTAQTAQAMKNLREFQSAANHLHGKTVDVNARFQAENLFGGRGYQGTPGLGGPWKGSAGGSTVPKDGGAYSDRFPYMLAPGEEVISNRHGQADRHRALLKKINAGHAVGYADGGTIRPGHMSGDLNYYLDDFISHAGPPMWKKFFSAFMAAGGPHMSGSYRAIESMIARFVPGSIVTSDYRPGARTTFGNLSRHAMGKAVDYAPTMRLWDWLYPRRGEFYELLGPWGMFLKGRPYYDPLVAAMHKNHIHVSAYAQGTNYARRGPAWVGENGPELMWMNGGERVDPTPRFSSLRVAHRADSGMASAHGGPMEIHGRLELVNGEAYIAGIARPVANQQISRQQRRVVGAVS